MLHNAQHMIDHIYICLSIYIYLVSLYVYIRYMIIYILLYVFIAFPSHKCFYLWYINSWQKIGSSAPDQ